MRNRISQFISLLLSVLFVSSCATKSEVAQVALSGNRIMGIYIESFEVGNQSADLKAYFQDLLVQSLQKTYAPQIQVLDLKPGTLLESPEALYEIGKKEIDDVFVIDLKGDSNFLVPIDRPSKEELETYGEVPAPETQKVSVTAEVMNGANLRTVTRFEFLDEASYKTEFESQFVNNFNRAAFDVLKNPNIYPKSDPLHYANLLYLYGQNLERDSKKSLTCQTAEAVLIHYVHAAELFKMARRETEEASVAPGQQEKEHELNTRIEDSDKKAQVLQLCQTDSEKSFDLQVNYGSLDASFYPFIQKALEKTKLKDLLQKYTDKPVALNFDVDSNSSLNLSVVMRFDQRKYLGWTMNRIPEVLGQYHIISFDPYYALMQTLVYLKSALPPDSPRSLQLSFSKMEISLKLDTLLNGSVTLGVAGNYIPDEKRIALAYPKTVILATPTYNKLQITARSDEVFQEKGWMALSSCQTLDGTITEDGLLMKFFGRECKI